MELIEFCHLLNMFNWLIRESVLEELMHAKVANADYKLMNH